MDLTNQQHAPFWRRVLAMVIDGLVLAPVFVLLELADYSPVE